MPSLLTDAQKTAIANVFDDMHDTFARDITVYQKKNKIFVATNDTYNALYKRIKDAKTTRTEVTSTTVKARILYVDKQIERDRNRASRCFNRCKFFRERIRRERGIILWSF